MINLAGWHIN